MTYFVGRKATVGMAKEATRGALTTPAYFIPYASVDFDDKTEKFRLEEGYGNIQDSGYAYTVKKYGEGTIEGVIRDSALGLILTAVMGSAPTTTGSPSDYTHTFALNSGNQHQSLSLLVQDPNGATMFPMAMVDSFEITVEPEKAVEYSVSFRSRNGREWTSATTNFTALGNVYLHQHMVLKLANTVGDLAAASPISVRKFSIKFEKNLMDWDDVGTVTQGDILNRQFSISGSLELAYNDRVYRDYMLNDTYKAMDLSFIISAVRSLQMQFPRLDFYSWEKDVSLDDIASNKIEFKANYDAANALSSISTCVLKNGIASY